MFATFRIRRKHTIIGAASIGPNRVVSTIGPTVRRSNKPDDLANTFVTRPGGRCVYRDNHVHGCLVRTDTYDLHEPYIRHVAYVVQGLLHIGNELSLV